jgi:hypothetical protein
MGELDPRTFKGSVEDIVSLRPADFAAECAQD